MNQIYRSLGTSKQNVHQRLAYRLAIREEQAQLLPVIRQIREDHPQMGARTMYAKLELCTMGRDKFMAFYRSHRFGLLRHKNFRKTTDSNGVIRFPNLVAGRELNGVNQVWVSDITYYEITGRFFYLVFIMDLYSRKIKGYRASKTLRAIDTTIPAVKMALRTLQPAEQPIFHSDGGGQYYSKQFLKITAGKLQSSMCESVYENAHAERINGTIKNDYLKGYNPSDFDQLKRQLKRAVTNYNHYRPHRSLNGMTPHLFEEKAKQGIITMAMEMWKIKDFPTLPQPLLQQ